jgi:hypothetical protein
LKPTESIGHGRKADVKRDHTTVDEAFLENKEVINGRLVAEI